MKIRFATADDTQEVLSLYRRVAANPGGIARLANEVDEPYVRNFLSRAETDGLGLVVTDEIGNIAAEMHAYRPGIYCFSHVLSDLTIVVDPKAQGCGIGRQLFEAFLDVVLDQYPDIDRVELIARQSNHKAIKFYQSLGFKKEGKLYARIMNPDGSLECDIPMAWSR